MRLSAFLDEAGVARADVTLLMHNTPREPLRSQMPWLAAHRPDLFAAYQAVHNDKVSATIAARPLLASFAATAAGRQLFLGLFRILSAELRPRAEIYADPRFAELARDFGGRDVGPQRAAEDGSQRFFILDADERMAPLAGRLEVATPAGRAYARRGDTTDPEVTALYPSPVNGPQMPDWRELVVTPGRLRNLPMEWSLRLGDWRGVYLIVDQRDGARYVGAAYGVENLLGRWRAHLDRNADVPARLAARDPNDFQFSILELTAPTAPADEVIACETAWKTRLHTRQWGLNEN